MMLSKLWYIILGALAATCASAVILSQQAFNRHFEKTVQDQTRRDRFEVEMWLKRYARLRTDALLGLTGDSTVRRVLRLSSVQSEIRSTDKDALQSKVREINKGKLGELKGDLLFAVNEQGAVVAQVGGRATPEGGGLARFPLIDGALSGYILDDVWMYDGEIYLMAARPVIDQARYVGAIVHGKQLDQAFAEKLATRIPGATLAFFVGKRVSAAHVPPSEANAPRTEELAAGLEKALASAEVKQGKRSEMIEISERGAAVYSLFKGTGAHVNAGYGVARPRVALRSPLDVFDLANSEDTSSATLMLILALAICLGLGFLGIVFLTLEVGRPSKRLLGSIQDLNDGQMGRIPVTDFRSIFRRLGVAINDVLDRAPAQAGSAGASGGVDIDQLLGSSGGADQSGASSYFGFANEGAAAGGGGVGGGTSPQGSFGGSAPSPQIAPAQVAPAAPAAHQAKATMLGMGAVPAHEPQVSEQQSAHSGYGSAPGEFGMGGDFQSLPPEEIEDDLFDDGAVTTFDPPQEPAVPAPVPSTIPPPKKVSPKRSADPSTRKGTAFLGGDTGPKPPEEDRPAPRAPMTHQRPPLEQKRASTSTLQATPAAPPPAVNAPAAGGRGRADTGSGKAMWANLRAKVQQGGPKTGFGDIDDDGATQVAMKPPFESREFDINAPPEEEATVITPETQNLIAAVSRAKSKAGTNADDKEFRKLYDQYRLLRRRCGEPTQDLTFEKFSRSLRKSRAQIKASHGNVPVVFKVFEKNGKATIKASPRK